MTAVHDLGELQRRSFIFLLGAGMLAPKSVGAVAEIWNEQHISSDGSLRSAAAIGQVLVQSGKVDGDIKTVLQDLEDRLDHVPSSPTDMLTESLIKTCQRDFVVADIIRIEGIILGRTEALAYGLVHLLAGPKSRQEVAEL